MGRKSHSVIEKSFNTTNVIVCGVGGQGILLASDILCTVAFLNGNDVKKSEIHGMAQRGGSVITHVRFGKRVFSPLIEAGRADFVLAFEKLEALRYSYFLKENGCVIANDLELPPMSVLTGVKTYPHNIQEILNKVARIDFVPAQEIASKLGNVRVVNVVLLGSLARFLDFDEELWINAIKEHVKQKYIDQNIRAFRVGMEGKY